MVEVLSSGIYSTIQDLGRWGYQKFGVPVSGVMDQRSALLANELLDNNANCAILEFTFTGPVLIFHTSTQIAITGGSFSPILNDTEIPMNTAFNIAKGDCLKFRGPEKGCRGYLSIAGGFQTENVMGSYSWYEGITQQNVLAKGNLLPISLNAQNKKGKDSKKLKIDTNWFSLNKLEVAPMPEFDLMSKELKKIIFNTELTIKPQSNRMAYQLNGLEHFGMREIITGPVKAGTVQLTPAGKCIVLMRDCQTTGGYARILQLSEMAINILAQKRANEAISFQLRMV